MEYRDSIFENLNTLSETFVWILLGDSALLSNYAIDTLKEHQRSKSKLQKSLAAVPTNIMSTPITDMVTDDEEEKLGIATCTLEEVWKRPGKSIEGRWWCVASYDNMTKKDRANLFNYIKNPCKTVTLVVTVSEYRNILDFKKSRAFTINNQCHTVNISYPSRRWLLKITRGLFLNYNIKLSEEQLDSFIMKLGTAYEEFKDCVDKVVYNLKALTGSEFEELTEVSTQDFKEAIKDIEHFEINDLLRYMLKPIRSDKPLNGRRAVHKALARLLEEMPAKDICNRLRYKVRDMLTYRAAINKGIIPVRIPYNAAQIQEKLPEDIMHDKIKKASAYAFKRNAYLSSLTSIEDWFFIYSMLESIPYSASEQQYLRVLLNIVNRTAVSNDRLMNNIGIKDTLSEGLVALNGILYSNWWQSLEQLEQ